MHSTMIRFWPMALLALISSIAPATAAKHKRARLGSSLQLRSSGHENALHARIDGNVLATTASNSTVKTNKKRCAKRVPVIAGAGNSTSSKPKSSPKASTSTSTYSGGSGCFPSLGFNMPSSVPSNTNGWWCDYKDEYAFVGFSYEVSACQSAGDLVSQFKDMRNRFNARYVRLYGACDRDGFYDDIINAAWESGLGVHALIWFGFDGSDIWETRRDTLLATLHSNPKAKFVTRAVQFGSEPLFDSVLSPEDLTTQVNNAKSNLKSLGIPVVVSDMAWSYQKSGGAQDVLDAIDMIDAHTLPYFAANAQGAAQSWGNVAGDISWFMSKTNNKKIWLTENGWPSQSSQGVQPNSPNAYTNIGQEKVYFDLLDSQCSYFKNTNGGIAWFAHIYSDDQEPGYGILYTAGGTPKFDFSPRTKC